MNLVVNRVGQGEVLFPGPTTPPIKAKTKRGGVWGRAGGSVGTEASARPGRLRLLFRTKLAQPSGLKLGDGYQTSILGQGDG